MKKGRDLELLVAGLERAASNDPTLKILSPYLVKDKTAEGAEREFDVGINIAHAHHSVVIGIECRDRSRSVTLPEVEAFAQKRKSTAIDKGVIVSSKGFAKDAMTAAKFHGISCYTLKEATDISWLIATTIDTVWSNLTSANWSFVPEKDIAIKPTNFEIRFPDRSPVPGGHLIATVQAEISRAHGAEALPLGPHKFSFRFLTPGFALYDHDTCQSYLLHHADVSAEVEVAIKTTEIKKWIYRDHLNDKQIMEVGVAPIRSGDVNGNLIFTSGENGIRVSFRFGEK